MDFSCKYIIYTILNLKTRKYYIGKTKRTLKERWQCHNYEANGEFDNMYIHASIRKHGKENFEIKQIDTAFGLKHSKFLESFYILYYRSNESKYGYNTIVHDLYDSECDSEQKEILSLAAHNAAPKHIGFDKKRGLYVAFVRKYGVVYKKSSKNLDFIKETKDKLNIALYKDYSKLFFPERADEYNKINFEQYLKDFNKKPNKFIGVSLIKRLGLYSSHIFFKNKTFSLGYYKTEIEAAIAKDKVHYFLHGDPYTKFNLPDLINPAEYIKDGKAMFTKLKSGKSLIRDTKSKYLGVWKAPNGKWSYRFTHNKIKYRGTELTEIEAAKQRDILAIKYGSKKLNFPELVEIKCIE